MRWETVPLGEVVSPVSSRAGARKLPVYSVTKHSGFVPSTDYFKKQVFSQDLSTYKVVEKGQFAYATIHLDEGSIGVAPEACIISPMYTVFSVDQSRVDAGYLIRLMKSPTAVAQYSRLGRGTAERRKSISLEALGRLGVHLPPLAEQRRIAAILDEAAALRMARRESLRLLHALPREILAQHDAQGWETVSLGEVASLQGGLTVNARRATLPQRAGYLRVANVFRGAIDLTEIKELGVSPAELERTRIRLGDLLVVEGHGNPDEVGRAALVTALPAVDLTHQNHLFRLRPDTDKVRGRYLELVLNSPGSRDYLRRVANTTSGLNTLNATSIRLLRMRLAPLSIQDEIVREVESVINSVRVAESSSTELDELFVSLQHRAFRGEL